MQKINVVTHQRLVAQTTQAHLLVEKEEVQLFFQKFLFIGRVAVNNGEATSYRIHSDSDPAVSRNSKLHFSHPHFLWNKRN